MTWLTANVSLLAPIISLAVDTKLFVQFIFRGPLLVLTVVYSSLATLVLMAGPAKHANVFGLFRFDWLYRLQTEGILLIFTVLYFVLVTLTRYMLRRYQRRQVMPA